MWLEATLITTIVYYKNRYYWFIDITNVCFEIILALNHKVRSQYVPACSNVHQHVSAIIPIHFNEPIRTNIMIRNIEWTNNAYL